MGITKDKRKKVWDKYEERCAYCGEKISYKDMQIDHIIPKTNFVAIVSYSVKNPDKYFSQIPSFLRHLDYKDINHIDNLNPSCRKCNNFKGSMHLELFRSELQKQLERANRYSTNYRFAKRYGQIRETISPIIFHFEKDNVLVKTSIEWYNKDNTGYVILDPDGWDRSNYEFSFLEERVTREEYEKRKLQSTVMFSGSKAAIEKLP